MKILIRDWKSISLMIDAETRIIALYYKFYARLKGKKLPWRRYSNPTHNSSRYAAHLVKAILSSRTTNFAQKRGNTITEVTDSKIPSEEGSSFERDSEKV